MRMESLLQATRGFSLLIGLFNDAAYRDKVATQLRDGRFGGSIVDATTAAGDYNHLEQQIADRSRQPIQLVKTERWSPESSELWRAMNYHRERIATICPNPLIIWVPEWEAQDFVTEAPDIWAWRSGVFDFTHTREVATATRSFSDQTPNLGPETKRISEIGRYLDTIPPSSRQPADIALLVERGDRLAAGGDRDSALADYQTAQEEYRAGDDPLGEARVKGKIADILYQRGELDQALKLAEEALNLARRLGDLNSVGSAQWRLARWALTEQDIDTALPLLIDTHQINIKLQRHDAIKTTGDTLKAIAANTQDPAITGMVRAALSGSTSQRHGATPHPPSSDADATTQIR